MAKISKYLQVKQIISDQGFNSNMIKTESDAINLVEEVCEEHFSSGRTWDDLIHDFKLYLKDYMAYQCELDRDYN